MHLLARRGTAEGEHSHSVVATFLLSSQQVEHEEQVAAELLRVCAFLHAEAIPEELFGAAQLGPALTSLAADPARFDLAIAVLRNLSLVQRQAGSHTLAIHRLVQTVLRESMSESGQSTP